MLRSSFASVSSFNNNKYVSTKKPLHNSFQKVNLCFKQHDQKFHSISSTTNKSNYNNNYNKISYELYSTSNSQPKIQHYQSKEFDPNMLNHLACPITGESLRYDQERQELISDQVNVAFPIRNGIPILRIEEGRKLDD